ncbi:phosphoadenylyl-sulfate reductase [Helicobacter sp. MIT 14-3879]|uniref:phosphoadenylyl-sulfate reductase n=1 Tax=Helicobacter sp. MIT 14-3879 TaxID=2040649 RepID=UPI000E1F9F3A|nr:phosphoadenylyl-sulfate reductase [Helicobacter sp. MIT 14-3879]RDU65500.1 phosphoadenylyl-sulfate reductase [Helicobacter sp. MIT 14-3879]
MLFNKSIQRLQETLIRFDGKISLAFSHQIEDVITIDLLIKTGIKNIEFFTLNTHKLFKESLEYQSIIEDFFNINIKSYSPTKKSLQIIDETIGEFGMRESLEKRKQCCYERKIVPLKDALKNSKAWISGIRIAQSVTRVDTKLLEFDKQFGIYKINPLFDWSDEQVWEYTKNYSLPINKLYEKGFKSIGCTPCTRAVKEGEDIRAGRWWWENPNHKECGLHSH